MYRMEKGCDLPQYLELDVSCNRKPVQRDQQCDMGSFGFIEDQLSRCVLNHLKRFDCTSWKSSQKSIAILQPRKDRGLDEKLLHAQ